MILNPEQYGHALNAVHTAGLKGADAVTSLATAIKRAGDTDYPTWVQNASTLNHDDMTTQYGNDAVRAVVAVARYAVA